MGNTPEIKVTENGPYEVSADLPIVLKRIVRSERGEPIAWATDATVPHETPTWLCRCGNSERKPFCDGHHKTVGFDGTETAATESFADRKKSYPGTGITVHRVGDLCAHSSFCANQLTDWYQLLPDTTDTTVRAEVAAMVEHCPSGALVLELDGEVVEPDLRRAISPVEDGPLWITGGVSIERSDGVSLEARNRVALCRCGRSGNKPFCDGTHRKTKFEAKNAAVAGPDSVATSPVSKRPPVYRNIAVGVHDATTEETFQAAVAVAMAVGSDLLLVHAGEPGADADRVLQQSEARVLALGLPASKVTTVLRTERPARALHAAALEGDVGLIVVGRGGDHLARLPAQVSHRSPCDVLVVGRGDGRQPAYQRILIATDGGTTADRAARRGYDLARFFGARVQLLFVGHPATGDLILSDTMSDSAGSVPTVPRSLRGAPAEQILASAREAEADLVVVGNKGMTGLRIRAGTSIPGEVLKGARCDVLLCRTVHQRESEMEPGDGGVIERDGQPVAAFMDEAGQLHLMSARCTHLGCTVAWSPATRTFDCPCHGSHFGPTGEVLEGPATRPLPPL